jgi:hypothetical protein
MQKQFDAYKKAKRDDLIDLTVGTDYEGSHVDGRNGMFHIQQLYIWESVDHKHVYLEGIGKRGYSIRGGLLVSLECFRQAASDFLAAYQRLRTAGQKELPAAAERCERIPDEEATYPSGHLGDRGGPATAAMVDAIKVIAERREQIPDDDPKTVFEAWKMRCPECCSDEGIEIQADVWVRLHHDGTTTDDTQDGGHEWSAQSPAQCRRCDFSGTVLDFEIVVDDEERSNGPKKR